MTTLEEFVRFCEKNDIVIEVSDDCKEIIVFANGGIKRRRQLK